MQRKNYLLIFLLCLPWLSFAQWNRPVDLEFSYFGATITHPGLRVGLEKKLLSRDKADNWDKLMALHERRKSKGKKIRLLHKHQLFARPSVGFFYHRRNQTGLFFLTNIQYQRDVATLRYFGVGVGLGYLRSYIPKVYEVSPNGEVNPGNASHGYLLTSLNARWERFIKKAGFSYFIQPQFLYALPNFPNGVGHFALELGIRVYVNRYVK